MIEKVVGMFKIYLVLGVGVFIVDLIIDGREFVEFLQETRKKFGTGYLIATIIFFPLLCTFLFPNLIWQQLKDHNPIQEVKTLWKNHPLNE